VAPAGNQAINGENKPQPVVSGETGLLDSIFLRGHQKKKANKMTKAELIVKKMEDGKKVIAEAFERYEPNDLC
jgi:hypothetical protein